MQLLFAKSIFILGSTIGIIKGDTRSLDYGSCGACQASGGLGSCLRQIWGFGFGVWGLGF